MNIFNELVSVVEALDAATVDYALVGGLAVTVWGAPRATKDIDLLVQSEDVARAKAAVRPLGYTLEALPMEFRDGMQLHRVSKVIDRALMTVDFILVNANLETVWRSRHRRAIEGGELSVVSARRAIEGGGACHGARVAAPSPGRRLTPPVEPGWSSRAQSRARRGCTPGESSRSVGPAAAPDGSRASCDQARSRRRFSSGSSTAWSATEISGRGTSAVVWPGRRPCLPGDRRS